MSRKTKTVARSFVWCCIVLATPAGAARCVARDSCNVGQGQDCSICATAKSREPCTQIAVCEWLSSCRAASACSWFQNSACVPKGKSAYEDSGRTQELCEQGNSAVACAGITFCEWKQDCRQRSKLTAKHECQSRDFCEWDRMGELLDQ